MAAHIKQETAVALRERGNASYRENQLGEAETLFKRALAVDGTDAKAAANLSAVYLRRKDYMNTFSYAAQAMRLASEGEPAGKWHYRCGRALVGLRQYDRALDIFDRALRYPDVQADVALCASILKRRGQITAARAAAPAPTRAESADEDVRVENYLRAVQGNLDPVPLPSRSPPPEPELIQ